MTETTNMDVDLDPVLKRMLTAYGNIPARIEESARRTREKFLMEIGNVLLEPTLPRSAVRRSSQAPARFYDLVRLRKIGLPAFANPMILRRLVMILIAAAIVFSGAGVTVHASSSSLPGDAIYPLKTMVENARVNLTIDSGSRARLYLDYAGRRLSEIRSLINEERYTDLARAAEEYERNILKALSAVDRLSQSDSARAASLRVEISAVLRAYTETLSQMLADLPADAQPAIRRALHAMESIAGDNNEEDDDVVVSTLTPAATITPLRGGQPSATIAASATQAATDEDVTNFTNTPDSAASQTPEGTAVTNLPETSTTFPAETPTVVVIVPSDSPTSVVVEGTNVICTSFIHAATVLNVEVPEGAACALNGTIVQGNIYVRNDATLIAQDVRVNGNLQAEGAANVEVLAGSVIVGNIQIKQGGSARIEDATVNGDIQLESNNGTFSILANRVGGNLQVFQNSGGNTIADNSINGNLQCKENSPAPSGGNNEVQGNKEDQCAGL